MKKLIPSPADGQKRTVKRFAWIPEEISDSDGKRYIVFFEFYNVEQKYVEGQVYINQEWTDVKKVVRHKKGSIKLPFL